MRKLRSILVVVLLAAGSASGDLLVSVAGGVDRYTDDGVFLGNLIAPGAGVLSDANGVGVAPSGDLLVADFMNHRILRFSSTGSFIGVFANGPNIASPYDVVIGTGGDVYVANSGLTTIPRFDPNTGALVDADFISGNVTPLGSPQYLEFGPALAITDVAGHLFRFNAATGAHISTSILDNPEGVAYGANGDLYVAQRISDRLSSTIPNSAGLQPTSSLDRTACSIFLPTRSTAST